MLLNLSDVFKKQDLVIHETVEIELPGIEYMGNRYSVKEKTPARWTFTNLEPGKVKVEAEAKLSFTAFCDRCLKETQVTLELHPLRYAVSPEIEEQYGEDVDDLSFMEGYEINTETLLYNEIVENWPAKILCKEDCKGLCLICGKNLNEGECGCDRFVPDPRMAAIKDLFNAGKEV